MSEKVPRRKFIKTGSAICATGGVALLASNIIAQMGQSRSVPDRGPRLNLEMVQEFVIAGHGNAQKVNELLTRESKLINAAWDWGGGDWETALGGAAHVGRKDIARLLLERGARIDLFAAAMLGQIEIVRAAIIAFPESRNIAGPHGITLLAHARAGGEESVAVVRYLESLERPRS